MDTTARTVRVAVWDWPIRIGHWLMVLLFALSWWTAENHYDDIHMWSGYGLLAILIFRILWGFMGSSTARFTQFVGGPRDFLGYLSNARRWTRIGHTPLGALSVLALLTLLGLQIILGLILFDFDDYVGGPLSHWVDAQTNELALQTHEAMFNLLLSFVALHIGAILFYRLVRRKKLTRAMITGHGDYPAGTEPMKPVGTGRMVACIAIALVLTGWVIAGGPPFGG